MARSARTLSAGGRAGWAASRGWRLAAPGRRAERRGGGAGRAGSGRRPAARPARGGRRSAMSASCAAARAGWRPTSTQAATSCRGGVGVGRTAAEHVGGQRGLLGGQVVAQRGPGHRRPAAVAGQRDDELAQRHQAQPLGQALHAPARPARSGPRSARRRPPGRARPAAAAPRRPRRPARPGTPAACSRAARSA
jgi:hypothetical protein